MDFPVELTPAAVAAAKRHVAKKGAAFLRIGVKGGGCTGLEYVMRPDDKRLDIDLSRDFDGLEVVCDGKSARFLAGTVIDFVANGLAGAFSFENPNAVRSCGCGTSFTPKTG